MQHTLVAAAVIALAMGAPGCGSGGGGDPGPTRPVAVRSVPSPVVPVPLVPWRGPVEHIFVHPLVPYPYRAFHGVQAQGFRDWFVTAGEFRRMLGELYRRRWVLVDIEAAVSGRLRVPRGRRPLVLSVDDLNYYAYQREAGLGRRLVRAPDGRVAVEVTGPHGSGTRLSRYDVVPALDDFVAAHPDFSVRGARGVLALTGYEGVLGERTNRTDLPGNARRIRRARAVVRTLTAEGWRFASHSWGHIDLSRSSGSRVVADAERWRRQVQPIVGRTDVYVYPFGAVPTAAARETLHRRFGFRVFCTIEPEPRLNREGGVVVMARRHIDGVAFRDQAAALRPLFPVAQVVDRVARR